MLYVFLMCWLLTKLFGKVYVILATIQGKQSEESLIQVIMDFNWNANDIGSMSLRGGEGKKCANDIFIDEQYLSSPN